MRIVAVVLCVLLWVGVARADTLQHLGQVPDFTLTDQTGAEFHGHDLHGQVWLADFIYTTCPGPCPLLTRHMSELQAKLPARVHFVSFSVDPGTDTPPVLARYAADNHAEPGRWTFLTGSEATILQLSETAFHLAAERQSSGPMHSEKFVLVDGDGAIRAYFDGNDTSQVPAIVADAASLQGGGPYQVLPSVDAVLNGLSAVLVLLGYAFIRRHQVTAHKIAMLSAFASSSVFLTCYLVYHYHAGHVMFGGQGPVRELYYGILLSHTILALVTVPLVITTLSRALRGRFELHRAIARWTFPIWLYVSCTGVVVYVMLYHMYR